MQRNRTLKALAILLLTMLAGIAAAPSAFALSLEQARSSGLVGETARGYIAPVKAGTPEITQLVNSVNAGRRAEYQRVAQRTGSSLEQVEILAAQKIFNQVPSGTYVQGAGGRWTRK